MIARVAVNIPYSDPYDYLIPDNIIHSIKPGIRVLVPLGSRIVIGVVVELTTDTMLTQLKEVVAAIDKAPVFSTRMLQFTGWIASYYLCSWAETLDAALPGAMKPKIKHRIMPDPGYLTNPRLTEEERTLLKNLEIKSAGILKSSQSKRIGKQLQQWQKEGLIRMQPFVADGYHAASATEEWVLDNPGLTPNIKVRRGSKADQMLNLLTKEKKIRLSELKGRFPAISSVIHKLSKQGAITIKTEPRSVGSFTRTIASDRFLSLNLEQQSALDPIQMTIRQGQYATFLLFGITGSGKTEVYLHAVRETLIQGKSALILIPEISLTPQAVERFENRFGDRIAVLHSRMTDKQRAAEWWKIKRGECDIVIGARSAIFAPLENIGLIVVDEEHDTSYKQQETPFYNARDAAVKLASDLNAVVILGSATPAVESYYNAQVKKYQLLELRKRANLKPLPATSIINLKQEKRQAGAFYLSTVLVEKLKETLVAGKQVLVFLNRRGFASYLSCKECDLPVLCRNCSIAMTWHKSRKQLVCHHCGASRSYPDRCESCGAKSFRMEGIGTQRIEQDLQRLFPAARFLRMDRDSVQKRGVLEKSIDLINKREVDFVVGTQLISKGHDFKHIGVVCIVLADMSLNFPDFRSSERSFQLISQVSGRAGRDEAGEGITLIQTYNPDHFAIQTAVTTDYREFYRQEIELRQSLANPPYYRLILLKISNTAPEQAQATATKLGVMLKTREKNGLFQVMGPIESPIQKINKRYYWQILLKAEKTGGLKNMLKQLFWDRKAWQPVGSTRVSIDVDPYMMV